MGPRYKEPGHARVDVKSVRDCQVYQGHSMLMSSLDLFHQLKHELSRDVQGFVFVCFVALRPKSTAMVMAGRSVDLTTLFPGQA